MWRQLVDLVKQTRFSKRTREESGGEVAEDDAEEILEDDAEEEEIPEDEQFERIDALLGNSRKRGFRAQVKVFFEHLYHSLELPCEVTGREDFRWEERYVIGPGSQREYARLRKEQPSYRDRYDLLKIVPVGRSEWMLWSGEDIGAHVRRKSDGKEFILGLAELEAVDEGSANHDLLEDYAVFFVNYR